MHCHHHREKRNSGDGRITVYRVKELLNPPEEEPVEGTYFAVFGDCGWYCVSRETAQQIGD